MQYCCKEFAISDGTQLGRGILACKAHLGRAQDPGFLGGGPLTGHGEDGLERGGKGTQLVSGSRWWAGLLPLASLPSSLLMMVGFLPLHGMIQAGLTGDRVAKRLVPQEGGRECATQRDLHKPDGIRGLQRARSPWLLWGPLLSSLAP